MEFKGTKGSWIFESTPPTHEPKCSTIEVYGDSLIQAWICKVQNNGVIEEQEGRANATLIAAAPDLLEALISLTETCEKHFSEEICLSEAKKAIEKALTIK